MANEIDEMNSALAKVSVSDAPAAPPSTEADQATEPSESPKNFVKLFVGAIGPQSTEESLKEYFSKYGSVQRVVVKHSFNDTRRSFAFITIDGGVEQIMATKHTIDGQTVAPPELARSMGGYQSSGKGVRHPVAGRDARGAQQPRHGRKIFVGGLSHQTNEDALRGYFEQFGKLTDAVVMHEAGSRKPRGFGFVTFADPTSVTSVLQTRYHPIDGRGVEVKAAVPREMMLPEGSEQADGSYEYSAQGNFSSSSSSHDYPIYGYMPTYGYMMGQHGSLPAMGGGEGSPMEKPAQGIRVLYGIDQASESGIPTPAAGTSGGAPGAPGAAVPVPPSWSTVMPSGMMGPPPPDAGGLIVPPPMPSPITVPNAMAPMMMPMMPSPMAAMPMAHVPYTLHHPMPPHMMGYVPPPGPGNGGVPNMY